MTILYLIYKGLPKPKWGGGKHPGELCLQSLYSFFFTLCMHSRTFHIQFSFAQTTLDTILSTEHWYSIRCIATFITLPFKQAASILLLCSNHIRTLLSTLCAIFLHTCLILHVNSFLIIRTLLPNHFFQVYLSLSRPIPRGAIHTST